MNMPPEMQALIDREKDKARKNKIKNRPIVFSIYVMVLVFLCMFGYIIYYMSNKAERTVANASNKRQDSFADFVKRGDIITSDGTVVATTEVDDNGNEKRVYPYNGLFSHVVGYNEYGRAGVELSANFTLLRSHVGLDEQLKNDLAEEKNPGDNVILNLDYNLQNTAAEALGNARGAVVVLDASTSDVLAMYSSPTFNPNEMATVWETAHTEEGQESALLLNRATQGLYAPGSTFKVITAMEYIREHPDYENYSHVCNGTDIYNSVSIRCSNSTAHGTVDLKTSLAKSCNTSFADIGVNSLDMDSLADFSEKLLYNKDVPFEGDTSKPVFKLNGSSDKSYIPQTVIGQGDTLTTPLHNALIMQAVANGGSMMEPSLIDRVESADGSVVKKYKPKAYGQVIDPEVTRAIIPMLEEVCNSGTASSIMAGKPYTVAGKTGTAEYDNNGNCNSWFVGFSSKDKPDIVVSVVVEDYTSNQISGTSVASRIMDAYYAGQ